MTLFAFNMANPVVAKTIYLKQKDCLRVRLMQSDWSSDGIHKTGINLRGSFLSQFTVFIYFTFP